MLKYNCDSVVVPGMADYVLEAKIQDVIDDELKSVGDYTGLSVDE